MVEMHEISATRARRSIFVLGAATILIAALSLNGGSPARATALNVRPAASIKPRASGPVPSNWLAVVSYYRSLAGLPPVTEKTSLSADDQKHAKYMVKNQVIGHSEDPALPYY